MDISITPAQKQPEKQTSTLTSHAQQIFGTRAIIETIQAGQSIDKVFIDKAAKTPLHKALLALLREKHIPHSHVPTIKLRKLTPKNHQGAVALLAPIPFAPLDRVVQASYEQGKTPLILLLDGITDVKNFGAIVRTATCTGADALVIPTQGSAAISGDALKASAGALAHTPICRVTHLTEAIQYLQACGLHILACHEKAPQSLYKTDLNRPLALILGAEDQGIAPQHLRQADAQTAIPITGPIASLNVSVAAAIILYEAIRQRQT